MEATIYNQKGIESGTIALPEHVFGVHSNADLVHQVVTSLKTSARKPYAHTKTRGEVRGGGKKPWKQKGTGRARHGSSRSPIWVGGGVAHGPRNDRNFDRKVGKTMKAKALFTVLSDKMRAGHILFVDSLAMEAIKTSNAKNILKTLGAIKGFEGLVTKRNNAAYVALGTKNEMIEKSFRNLGHLAVTELRNISPVELLNYKYIVITEPQKSVDFLAAKMKAPIKKEKMMKAPKMHKAPKSKAAIKAAKKSGQTI